MLTALNLNPGILPTPGTTIAPQYYFDPNGGRPPRVSEWSIGIQHHYMNRVPGQSLYLENLNCHCIDPKKQFPPLGEQVLNDSRRVLQCRA
ncbi:MAG: hypothetical protein ABSG79_14835 [Bryobacteraceae bacterium]